MNRVNDKEIILPFDLPIVSVEIIYRGESESWFHDKANECKVLVRLQGLDEEGIGMHLTETAKVLQWILWAPLIGDPNTSRRAPDRLWRESTFTSPYEFLLTYVDDSKTDMLESLVSDRWDTGMMLGGADRVKILIWKYIRSYNQELKKIITEWLRFLKWHQEFDWDEVSEYVLFGSGKTKLDVFWESDVYNVPEKYKLSVIWSPDTPNVADNIRKIVAEIPGFEELKENMQDQSSNEGKAESSSISTTASPVQSSPQQVNFRSDMPNIVVNKVAFESNLTKHSLWKSNPTKPGGKRIMCLTEDLSRKVKSGGSRNQKWHKGRKENVPKIKAVKRRFANVRMSRSNCKKGSKTKVGGGMYIN